MQDNVKFINYEKNKFFTLFYYFEYCSKIRTIGGNENEIREIFKKVYFR